LAIGFSAASRLPFVAYAIVPASMLSYRAVKPLVSGRWSRSSVLDMLLFGGPIALTCLLLLLYNELRFGSPLEFGMSYILQGSPDFYDLTKRPDQTLGSQFSIGVMGDVLALYTLSLPIVQLSSPFIASSSILSAWPDVWVPDRFILLDQPMISIVLIAPVTLLVSGLLVK